MENGIPCTVLAPDGTEQEARPPKPSTVLRREFGVVPPADPVKALRQRYRDAAQYAGVMLRAEREASMRALALRVALAETEHGPDSSQAKWARALRDNDQATLAAMLADGYREHE